MPDAARRRGDCAEKRRLRGAEATARSRGDCTEQRRLRGAGQTENGILGGYIRERTVENRKEKYGYREEEYIKFKKYAIYMLAGFSVMYCFLYNGRQNMNLAISFQTSLAVIAILWGLNGFAQSMAFSPGVALSNKWWPKDKRGFASGVIAGSGGIAQVVTYFCVLAAYYISPDMGWRAALRWPLAPMILILFVFSALVKNSPRDVGLKDFEEKDEEAAALEAARMRECREKARYIRSSVCSGSLRCAPFYLSSPSGNREIRNADLGAHVF